jgi:hypothetical protein
VLAAAGYNFGLLLRWLESLLRALIRMLFAAPLLAQKPKERSSSGSSRMTGYLLECNGTPVGVILLIFSFIPVNQETRIRCSVMSCCCGNLG